MEVATSPLMDKARAELLEKMKAILSDEEFRDFQAAPDRPRGGNTIINVGPPDTLRPGDLERRKADPRQKQLDESRRELRR